MEGEYNSKEAFLKYKREQEEAGIPIDSRAIETGKKEMELGEKGGFPIYGDEPDKKERFKNEPEGTLYKTNLTVEELEEEILGLTVARKTIVLFLEKPSIEDFEITRETTLFDLENKLIGQTGELNKAVSDLSKYNFDGDTTLFDLPEEIKRIIGKDTLTLEHLQRKTSK